MYTISALVLVLGFSLFTHAAGQNFPIQVTCTESPDSEPVLSLAVRASTNEASLFYKTPAMAEPIIINFGDAYGHNSSASVTIESSRGDRMSGNQGMKFSAHNSRVGLRTFFYKNFDLELERMSNGSLMGKKLHYATGKEVSPDTQSEATIEFDSLTCMIAGL